LLSSAFACRVVLVLGLVRRGLFVDVLVPGMAMVFYSMGIAGFDLEFHSMSALFVVLVDVVFRWPVICLSSPSVADLAQPTGQPNEEAMGAVTASVVRQFDLRPA
jgi:hypothetical protein